mmetsp:Transcript_49241/g.119341  ORF Transcript_49241/g.119341 Transcript_49241/m.119341 type:complete len:681 (+) Transcript_49241:458-2500(+)
MNKPHHRYNDAEIGYGGNIVQPPIEDRDDVDDMSEGSEGGRSTTVAVIVVSLLFVAVFAGALVGGVVSGDPSNVFFVTIITASVVAVVIALGIAVWYCRKNRLDDEQVEDGYLSKPNGAGKTFSHSHSEDEEEQKQTSHRGHDHAQKHPYAHRLQQIQEAQQMYNEYPKENSEERQRQQQILARTPVDARIKEISASGSVAGLSALSPQTYGDIESLSTRRPTDQQQQQQRSPGLFDFANVAPSPSVIAGGRNATNRVTRAADPPEGSGRPPAYNAATGAWSRGRMSMDPSARKITAEGELVDVKIDIDVVDDRQNTEDEERADIEMTPKTTLSPNNGKEDPSDIENDDEQSSNNRRGRSRSRSRSRSGSRSRSRSRSRSKSPFRSKKSRETKSDPDEDKNSSVPPTPAASDVGSVASSFFRQIGRLAGGGKKKTSSEAGSAVPDAKPKTKVNPAAMPNHSIMPPKPATADGKDNKESSSKRPPRSGGSGLSTIGGTNAPPPQTPGNKSTFTVPPPRHVPSTPGAASVAFSEYKSMVGSVAVASSTFDPVAHQKALQKMQQNDAALGAGRPNDDSMPIYYEDDDRATSIASYMPSNGAYDVFAPPGPIGIVVDTTKGGCVVHSLKKTSPMQGLINPGDLIIALDDFDVRKMNAASLTKLMAKKSKQPERKFTLEPTGELS